VSIRLAFVGDLMLSAPDPAAYFADVAPALRSADIAIGHLEWPHTERGQVSVVDIPAPACPPAALDALADAGIAVATMAGNHMFDQGVFGVLDSVEALRERGMEPVGAGATIDDARRPAIVERGGVRVGFLSYNCVGPRESWATAVKAGVAPVRIINHYELDIASPGSAPREYTSVDPDAADELRADVAALAARVDIVCVSLHKGMGFVRAALAQYEREVTRIAVDAGADVVIGHHAHILRGVEVYRGRPVFHGINHFVPAYTAETDPLNPRARRPRPRKTPSLEFFRPDPGSAPFPFPRESRHTMIATVDVEASGVVAAGFVPCWIGDDAHPRPVTGEEGRATVDYVRDITHEAGLEAGIGWDDAAGAATFLPLRDQAPAGPMLGA
jgi:poly-gamma-glutamate synthesis protein (capsule biosynthesis protein)